MFAKRRHVAQTFLDIALLVNNVSHLVSVYVSGGHPELKRTLLGLIISSIILQITAAFLLFHITCVYHLVESREITLMVTGNADAANGNDDVEHEIGSNENQTGFCYKLLYNSSLESYETTILVLDLLATAIILLVTVLNVFISAFFQLHTNLETVSGDIMGHPDLFEIAVRERVDKLLKEKNITAG